MTKMVTTSRHAATVSAVMVANGEATCEKSEVASTEAPPSSSPKSSFNGDNCWSPAMRLLPAGDEFMQPPEEYVYTHNAHKSITQRKGKSNHDSRCLSTSSYYSIYVLLPCYIYSLSLPEFLSQWQHDWSAGCASVGQQGTHWLLRRSRCSGKAHVTHEYWPGPLHERQDSWHVLHCSVGGS